MNDVIQHQAAQAIRIQQLEAQVAALQLQLAAIRGARTAGFSVGIPERGGQRMLFVERARAEQAAVQYHGLMAELIERPVA